MLSIVQLHPGIQSIVSLAVLALQRFMMVTRDRQVRQARDRQVRQASKITGFG